MLFVVFTVRITIRDSWLPWQERSSVSSLKPFLQLHSKLPMVFRQKCSQPPFWSSHSSISEEDRLMYVSGALLSAKSVRFFDVNSEADLCMFFRPAAAWSRQGSCSARLWMCLYRCSRTPHCSLRRFLKLQHTRWVCATPFLNVKYEILRKTEPLLREGCALNTERPVSEYNISNIIRVFNFFF